MIRQVGDRVIVTNPKSVHWFTGPHMRDKPMSITGNIIEIDPDNYFGPSNWSFKIKFDDGREAWYGTKEIRKIK